MHSAFTIFLSLIVEAMPFLVLGILLSSAILVLVDRRRLGQNLPKNPVLGALAGSLIGFIFPACECGNVPVARRLLVQQVPTAVSIGFLLAAPTINPITIWSTWVAFRRFDMVVLRVVFSLIVAVVIACVFSVQKDVRPILHPALARTMSYRYRDPNPQAPSQDAPALLQSGTFLLANDGQPLRLDASGNSATLDRVRSLFLSPDWQSFLENVTKEFRELGAMLVLGSAIATTIQAVAPRELILSLGQGPTTSILAMMLLGALVSICSSVDAFFALSFASSFTTGSLLAFLVFGPIIDLKSIGLMMSVFRPRVVVYLFALAAQLTFVLTLGYSYFF